MPTKRLLTALAGAATWSFPCGLARSPSQLRSFLFPFPALLFPCPVALSALLGLCRPQSRPGCLAGVSQVSTLSRPPPTLAISARTPCHAVPVNVMPVGQQRSSSAVDRRHTAMGPRRSCLRHGAAVHISRLFVFLLPGLSPRLSSIRQSPLVYANASSRLGISIQERGTSHLQGARESRLHRWRSSMPPRRAAWSSQP